MTDPRQIPQLDRIVDQLDTTANSIRALLTSNYQHPLNRIFDTTAGELQSLITKLKETTFRLTWKHLKEANGLGNTEDDYLARQRLCKTFTNHQYSLPYNILEDYFHQLSPQANKLALDTILKIARRMIPYRPRPKLPQDLVIRNTVRLSFYRCGYSPNKFPYSETAQGLASLEQLAAIAVYNVDPAKVAGQLLNNEYINSGDVSGKRVYTGAPFTSTQSFKNGRFDLTFADPGTALDFAHLLMTGRHRRIGKPQR